ncbi:hypothetical protein TrCOL_g4435 [Triparma columacea]|uniref:Uncharacterized protein n=1 Tax=Triparma columacea TaxID=722753 RepID=A0A9W7G8K6_9STRA|nr:hypothetical protein TrCOL_g4435 [Triparma columacea]
MSYRRFTQVPPGGHTSISLSWGAPEEPAPQQGLQNHYSEMPHHAQTYHAPQRRHMSELEQAPQQYYRPQARPQQSPQQQRAYQGEDNFHYEKEMKLLQAKREQSFASACLEPAGAKSGEVTHADNYSEYQPFEQPLRATKRTAFPQYAASSGSQGRGASVGPSVHELEIQRVEAERRRREKEREEANLYRAVQPGNDLNRHVTGEVYAQQLMADISEQRMKNEEDKRRKIEEERRDEERVRREAAALRNQVVEEIDKQKERQALVERRDEIARQQYERRLDEAAQRSQEKRSGGRGGFGNGFSTSDYFEGRLSKPKNPHASKLQEMREKRWQMEESSGKAGMGNLGAENRNPQQLVWKPIQPIPRQGGRASSINLSWE